MLKFKLKKKKNQNTPNLLLREGVEFIGTQVRETIQFIAFLEVKMIVTLFYETLFRRCIEMFAAQNKTGMVSDRIKKIITAIFTALW